MLRMYVVEKDKQAKILSKVMGIKYHKDPDTGIKIGEGKWKGMNVVVVPLAGHILEHKTPQELVPELEKLSLEQAIKQKVLPIFPKLEKKVKKPERIGNYVVNYPAYFKTIKKWGQKAEEIVAAPDPDAEGMALFFEVIYMLGLEKKVVGSIKLNVLEEKAVKKALEEPLEKVRFKYMAQAGLLRGEYDWLLGMNLSMGAKWFLTNGKKTLHIGGVKTPTLRMVVERDLEIENFKPEKFYNIEVIVEKDDIQFPVQFNTKIKEEEKQKVFDLKKELEAGKYLVVDKFEKKETKKAPPKPYSTNNLQSFINSRYKIPLKQIAKIMQDLYLNEYQSYPRTDCEAFSTELWKLAPNIINNILQYKDYKNYRKLLDFSLKRKTAFNDKEVEKHSHTAIAPTEKVPFKGNNLLIDDKSFKVYDAVVRRFLSQFAPDAKLEKINGKAYPVNNEKLKGTFGGSRILELGYMQIENNKEEDEEINDIKLPELKKGYKLKIIKVNIKETVTKPKPRFTQATLLKAMEKVHRFYDDPKIKQMLGEKGIGTPATREGIITALIEDGYLKVEKGKLISTPLGRELIKSLPDKISNPILRADLEEMLRKIERTELKPVEFKNKTKELILNLWNELANAKNMTLKPTDKQIKYAKTIIKNLGLEENKDYNKNIFESIDNLKNFIEKYKDKLNCLSEKQIQIIKNSNPPENILSLLENINNISINDEECNQLRKYIENLFNSKKYILSDKQLAIIEKHGTKTLQKLIQGKKEFTKQEYDKLKKWLDSYFKKLNKKRKK